MKKIQTINYQNLKQLMVLSCLILSWTVVAQTRVTELDAFRTNNTINKMVVDEANEVLYMGGDFTRIEVKTNGVAADLSTADVPLDFPEVEGTVLVSIPDGAGGFFIGGDFSKVGGVNRSDLAHINASGELTSWPGQFNIINSRVNAMVLDNGYLYVGGFFTNAFHSEGYESRRSIVKYDATTGDVEDWYPTGGVVGTVNTLEVIGSELYIGGTFSTVGGTARSNLASVNITTGIVSSWSPSTNGDIYALKRSQLRDGHLCWGIFYVSWG